MQRAEAASALERREARRSDVVRAARRVIIRRGLADTTLRDIAREGGFTTGVLTHHFPDKRAVIFGAFTSASRDWIEDGRRVFASATTPRELVIALVNHLIPIDVEGQQEWRLWIEMWTYAGTDREFAEQVIHADMVVWQADLARVIRQLQDDDTLRSDLDPDIEAAIINRLVDGLGVRAWLTGRWNDARKAFVMHLSSVGLPGDLVAELLRAPSARRRRK